MDSDLIANKSKNDIENNTYNLFNKYLNAEIEKLQAAEHTDINAGKLEEVFILKNKLMLIHDYNLKSKINIKR